MAIQSKHNEEHLVVAFESLRTNQLYVAHINLRSLDSLNDSSWRVVEVKDGVTGPVQAMAVGSCKGHLREGQILLNTVALTLQNGIALIDMSSGQTCGSFIPDDTGRVQTTYKDPAIISNAGVVSKVGSTLSLSWDMLEWGRQWDSMRLQEQRQWAKNFTSSIKVRVQARINNAEQPYLSRAFAYGRK